MRIREALVGAWGGSNKKNPMSSQLDILALEPFFGGARRAMLETVIRCSRHRWTLLKLPPRRMERRLTAAANWFAEQLSRHWVGHVDLLFTSEAMNLADLYRLVPPLSRPPSVVYFHDNQMPVIGTAPDKPQDLVNLNTASSATEIWFNSLYHLGMFLSRASAVVDRHSELASRSPVKQLTAKAHLMRPPIDLRLVAQMRSAENIKADPTAIFVETRDADFELLNTALQQLTERGQKFRLITVGPVDQLRPNWERKTVSESDDVSQIRGMCECGIFLSVKPSAAFDLQAIRALLAGCACVFPDGGVYPELLPESMHPVSLYQVHSESLCERLESALDGAEFWDVEEPRQALRPFEALSACRAFDERIEQLVAARTMGK